MRATLFLLCAACVPDEPSSGVVEEQVAGETDGHWTMALPMHDGRFLHTMTALTDTDSMAPGHGTAIVATGGMRCPGPCTELTDVEIYNPYSRAWEVAPAMNVARTFHTATQLGHWVVLVTGGASSAAGTTTEELNTLEPGAGWQMRASMNHRRESHTATRLPAGELLVIGGRCTPGCLVGPSELYRWPSDTWTITGSLRTPRYGHTATALRDGRVLVVGGLGASNARLASVEIYDPARGVFVAGPAMPQPRSGHTATLLASGRVLVVGGDATLDSAIQYDPQTNAWTGAGTLVVPRSSYTATELPTGSVLLAGGRSETTFQPLFVTELLDPVARTSRVTTPLNGARYWHGAARLASGAVVVAGGNPRDARSEVFDTCGPDACRRAVPSCACPEACLDSDGDGLSDVWETEGIDLDGNGTVDVDLVALGASWAHKDLFLQLDYMAGSAGGAAHSHRPAQADIDALVQMFARAPVANPDGATGIRLHLDVRNQIAETIPLVSYGGCTGAEIVDISELKATYLAPARKPVYRYGVIVHQICEFEHIGFSGMGDVLGDKFMVGHGKFCNTPAGCQGVPAGWMSEVVAHELGHTLGFSHNGHAYPARSERYPNYLGVMGRYQPSRGYPLDMSRAKLADLDENSLRERSSLGSDAATKIEWTCPAATPVSAGFACFQDRVCKTAPMTGGFDWNCDGVLSTTPVRADVNGDGLHEVLRSTNDWASLRLGFQCATNHNDGVVRRYPRLSIARTDITVAPRPLGDKWIRARISNARAVPVPAVPIRITVNGQTLPDVQIAGVGPLRSAQGSAAWAPANGSYTITVDIDPDGTVDHDRLTPPPHSASRVVTICGSDILYDQAVPCL
jgi:hypothetical protein